MANSSSSGGPPLLPEHAARSEPTRFPDNYVKLRSLGRGSFGEVFLATSRETGEEQAIKLVDDSEAVLRRHRREVELQSTLHSPNVMPILASGEGWHAMPVATTSLFSAGPELYEEECIEMLEHVSKGLSEAHKHKLVHRDVSPGNILSLNNLWVIADFGLVSRPRGESSVERTVGPVGTRQFWAPEMEVLGAHDVDHRADIYSLGRVIRFVLGGSPTALLDTPWERLLSQMTTINRESRLQTLDQVIAQIPDLRREVRAERRSRWVRKNQGGASAIGNHGLGVLRCIYSLTPAAFQEQELREFAITRGVSGVDFNIGFQWLRRNGFINERENDHGEMWGWRVTDKGEVWALENHQLLKGAEIEAMGLEKGEPDDSAPF
jgi:serine/threonine protein kinase